MPKVEDLHPNTNARRITHTFAGVQFDIALMFYITPSLVVAAPGPRVLQGHEVPIKRYTEKLFSSFKVQLVERAIEASLDSLNGGELVSAS
jgi:hypothetical protein